MTVNLSIVIPIYNEEAGISEAVSRIKNELDKIDLSYEIVCINDGSTDNTAKILNDIVVMTDGCIIAAHLSRNFGKEAAITAGLDIAKGDAAILIDADMQHPPNLIPKMVVLWRQGYDIVEACKSKRGKESFLYCLFAKIFYYIMSRATGTYMRGASDFKLLNRQAIDVLKSLPEKERFFRGLTNWIGFKRVSINFEVEDRIVGSTGWSLRTLVSYALNNILAFTTVPLYLTAWLGMITILFSIILGIQTLYNFMSGKAVGGFTTVILLIIFFAGITLTSIGIVAVYLAKVLEEVKGRPTYIIKRKS